MRKVTRAEKKDIRMSMTGLAWAIMLVIAGFGLSLFALIAQDLWMSAFAMMWGMLLTYVLIYADREFNEVEKKKKELIKAGLWYED